VQVSRIRRHTGADIAASETDYAWYNKTYRWTFGPLEQVTAVPS
jgi:hypothetical protein